MVPHSVGALNKWPYPNSKYQLGTRFHSWVKFLRNAHNIINEALSYSVLTNPTLIRFTATPERLDISTDFDYSIAGIIYTKAAVNDIVVTSGANTGAAEYKAITLSIDSAGTVTQTASAAYTYTPVPLPSPPSDECPFASIQIPPSFTADSVVLQNSWITNGWTGRYELTASIPAVLPATDI